MKEVNIKFFVLVNSDVNTLLKVRSGGKTIARLPSCKNFTLQIPEGQSLTVTYKFLYRTTIQLPKDKNKVFIVVSYYFREYFPAILMDLFKKILVANIVSEEEFDRANQEEYKNAINPRQDFKQDISVLVVGFMLSLIYILLPFSFSKGNENNRDLSFFIGVTGIIGFALLLAQEKFINLKGYRARVLVFSALSIFLIFIIPLSPFMKFALVLATAFLIWRVLMMKAKPAKSTDTK
jgi:uncharacterized membrane protein